MSLDKKQVCELVIFHAFLRLASELSLSQGLDAESIACHEIVKSMLKFVTQGVKEIDKDCKILAPNLDLLLDANTYIQEEE